MSGIIRRRRRAAAAGSAARRRAARWARAVAAAAGLLAGRGAHGDDVFITRGGASGLLDVPDGETLPRGVGRLGFEWGYRNGGGSPSSFAPTPLSVAAGLSPLLEAGFSLRESALPGDPTPAALVVGTAAKVRLPDLGPRWPALALALDADRLNVQPTLGARIAASTDAEAAVRVAAYLGAEGGRRAGATGGAAVALRLGRFEVVADALTGPDGSAIGVAIRARVDKAGLSVGLASAPGGGYRVAFGLALQGAASGADTPRRRKQAEPGAHEQPAAAGAASAAEDVEERTHGRLRIREARVPGDREGESEP